MEIFWGISHQLVSDATLPSREFERMSEEGKRSKWIQLFGVKWAVCSDECSSLLRVTAKFSRRGPLQHRKHTWLSQDLSSRRRRGNCVVSNSNYNLEENDGLNVSYSNGSKKMLFHAHSFRPGVDTSPCVTTMWMQRQDNSQRTTRATVDLQCEHYPNQIFSLFHFM